jgi:hypothetical protein
VSGGEQPMLAEHNRRAVMRIGENDAHHPAEVVR